MQHRVVLMLCCQLLSREKPDTNATAASTASEVADVRDDSFSNGRKVIGATSTDAEAVAATRSQAAYSQLSSSTRLPRQGDQTVLLSTETK